MDCDLRATLDSQSELVWSTVSRYFRYSADLEVRRTHANSQAEVPQVSEGSESNANLPTTQTADIGVQELDTPREILTHNEANAETEGTPVIAQTEVDVSVSSVVPQDVENPPRVLQSKEPKQDSPLGASTYAEKFPEVPTTEPAGAWPSNDLLTSNTHQESILQDTASQRERQIPPPPTTIPTSTSSEALPSIASRASGIGSSDTEISQPPPQHLQQPAVDIDLGNRQLLRTQRSGLNHLQRNLNVPYTYPSTSRLPNVTSSNHVSPQMPHLSGFPQNAYMLPQSLLQMNPRIQPAWLPWHTKQQQDLPSSPQIKYESLQRSPYLMQRSPAQPQDHAPGGTTLNRIIQSYQEALSPRAHTPQPTTSFIPCQNSAGNVGHDPLVSTPLSRPHSEAEPRASTVLRRRRRSSSLQITDVRPAQKPRLGDRDHTPKSRPIKVEESTGPGSGVSRKPDRSARAKAPPPRKNRPSEIEVVDAEPTPPQRQTNINQKAVKASTTTEYSQQHARSTQRHDSHVPASHRAKARRSISEDYDEDEEDIDDEFEVPDIQPRRQNLRDEDFSDLAEYDNEQSPLTAGLATRTTFGAPKPVQRAPLTLDEKHALELRYCARVAMVIGSKRCVMGPVEQISKTKNIFTIMKQKFGHVTEGEDRESSIYLCSCTL